MFKGLRKKVIILTGAGGLIGKETLKKLLDNGSHVVAIDTREFDNQASFFIRADVTKTEVIDEIVKQTLEKFGRIDGLVNLAYPRTEDWGRSFEDITFESWSKNVDMQLNSVFYFCQKVLKLMKDQGSGSIVNIGSIYGVVGNDFTIYEEYGGTSPAAYAAIKGGLINLTRYLAAYFGPYNVRVNCVSPGGILDEKNQDPSFIKNYSKKSPLKRLGNPNEIAPSICFLLSEDASFITGHNLMVDGGWTAI